MRELTRIITINGSVLGPDSKLTVVGVLGCEGCGPYKTGRVSLEVIQGQNSGAQAVKVRCLHGPLKGHSPCDSNKNCSVK